MKKYKELVSVAETLVKVFPDDPKVWLQLGSFYSQTEQYSKGLTTLEIAYKKGFFEKNHYRFSCGVP